MYTVAITANTSWYIYNFRRNTIISLINHGIRVIAISPFDDYSHKLSELGCEYIDIDIDQGGTNPFKDLKTACLFFSILKKTRPQCILNFTPKNNIYCTLVAKLLRLNTINNIAGLGSMFTSDSVSSRVVRLLYRFSQPFASIVFFQNEQDRTLFVKNRYVDKVKTRRLPGSGVDLDRFIYSPSDDVGRVRFLLIARMLYDKGIVHYVEAARELKGRYGDRIEFRLLGFLDVDNPSAISKAQMESWVREGIVIYLGCSNKVEREIAEVDCIVLPSFYREGVPKSLLEAGAMGKPIVTANSIGCNETVDDGVNGYLCEPRSTQSLIDALDKMFSKSHNERLVMGKASREKMSHEFDEQIVIDRYLFEIERIIK